MLGHAEQARYGQASGQSGGPQASAHKASTQKISAQKVSTQALADALEVAPASVTGMLRKLTEQGLVSHAPYQGAALTAEGERVALEVLRHHRLLELFLHRALGVPLDEVHE